MEKKATDKQMSFLDTLGYEGSDDISSQEASTEIERLLKPKDKYKKTIKEPQRESFKPTSQSSYYVAYAKDLCVAMLDAHIKARLSDPKIEALGVDKLMETAIHCIHMAKKEFE